MPAYNNRFQSPQFHQEVILDKDGNVRGTIRIKPSGILWKPKGKQSYYSVSLDDFEKWVTGPSSPARPSSS